MISALAWVPRGASKRVPEKFVLSKEEVEMMSQLAQEVEEDNEEVEEDEPEEDGADDDADMEGNDDDDDEALKEFNMDQYDEEDDDAAVKDYLQGNGAEIPVDDDEEDIPDDLDDADKADMEIRPTDSVVLVCNTEEDFSNLEVHVYEEDSGNLYVHHEINLPAFPLALAWMDIAPVPPVNGAPVNGSFVAVGTFKAGIEIWNLDVLDVLEPTATLGGEVNATFRDVAISKAMRKKHKAALKPGSHQDSVLGLDWNAGHRNMLASASADATVKIWDVTTQQCMHTMTHHTDKVQSVKWNPVESTILASASFDRSLVVLDGRAPHAYSKFALSADVESMVWHPHSPSTLVASTEDGIVVAYDVRKGNSAPLYRFQAHDTAVSAISFSQAIPGLFATAGTDKHVKIWDLAGPTPQCVASKDMQVGELLTLQFYRDSPFLLGTGGTGGVLALWDTSENDGVERKFATRAANIGNHPVPDGLQLHTSFKSANDIADELLREEEEQNAVKIPATKKKSKKNKK
ncbi:hypothetical protein H310_02370 [Aphanomyces invadans]|uniref:Anaphase-promoting complex subunit 4-like WD40 domain-containing protein n=1 Tax=Aphanomyces invadans TaxID=157072 RepID=A0A024UNX1_9STRA|nr:hypothetical protein H310_02370 [Aphanomyces invadans]ETW07984.1 hypothetical protein H310_02370 [Aphanomyces invadans]|eukprot:XP_008864077.1 hypothetical protein H310_02370 [Aphanomyces invadans]